MAIELLLGLTLRSVKGAQHDAEVIIETTEGRRFMMWHAQDCCESVYVESIVGDVADIIGEPITLAEEITNADRPAEVKYDYEPESETWTFYRIGTRKGMVVIRWCGQSNGYYSEAVDFEEMT